MKILSIFLFMLYATHGGVKNAKSLKKNKINNVVRVIPSQGMVPAQNNNLIPMAQSAKNGVKYLNPNMFMTPNNNNQNNQNNSQIPNNVNGMQGLQNNIIQENKQQYLPQQLYHNQQLTTTPINNQQFYGMQQMPINNQQAYNASQQMNNNVIQNSNILPVNQNLFGQY